MSYVDAKDLPPIEEMEFHLSPLHIPTDEELAHDQLFAVRSSPAAHQDPPPIDKIASAAVGVAGESSPRRSLRAAHQDPPPTDELASAVGCVAGESSAEKNKDLPASDQERPLYIDHLAFLTTKKKASPSTAPKPPVDSTYLDGLLSSFGQRQLITMLTLAYKKHLDVRADVSVMASEAERKIYVHNLPLNSTPVSVEKTFAEFGRIDDIVIRHSKLDKDTRRGSVLFFDVEGAARAVVPDSKGKKMDLLCHAAKEVCSEDCVF